MLLLCETDSPNIQHNVSAEIILVHSNFFMVAHFFIFCELQAKKGITLSDRKGRNSTCCRNYKAFVLTLDIIVPWLHVGVCVGVTFSALTKIDTVHS